MDIDDRQPGESQSLLFPSAFALAHLALAAAAILARPAALIFRRFFGSASTLVTSVFPPFNFAHRALCAAAIAALAALDRLYIPRPLAGTGADMDSPPVMASSCAVKLSISSLIETSFRSCATDKLCSSVIDSGTLPYASQERQEESGH
jgi:hypothetical protein